MTWSICLLNIFLVLREENVLNRLRTINICTIDYKIELSMDYPSTRNSMINLIKTQWNTNNSVQHVFSPLKIRFYILRLLLKAIASCVRMSYGQQSFIILRENVIQTRELYQTVYDERKARNENGKFCRRKHLLINMCWHCNECTPWKCII